MATLNVRINNKRDTLSNWIASATAETPLVLNAGEIAVVEIPTEASNSGLTPPAIGIKVGNGKDVFTDLPWIQALAGDVPAWVKGMTTIEDLNEHISTQVADTDTTYAFSIDGDTLTVKHKAKSETEFSDYVTLTIPLSSKVDKVVGATGNLIEFGADGTLVDTGKSITSILADIEGTYAKAADLDIVEEGLTEANGRIDSNAEAIALLNSDINTDGSVAHTVNEQINEFATKISDDGTVNTFKELVDYVADHAPEAADMAADILALEGRVDTLEDEVDAIQTSAHDHENKSVLDSITESDVNNARSAVQSIEGVTATKEGTKVTVTAIPTTLLVDGDETLTLNCGTATTVL